VPAPRLQLALLAACLGLAARAAAQSPAAPPPPPPVPPEPWQAPDRFLGAWLRGAAYFPASTGLQGARVQPAIGIGVGVRPLSFVTAEAEGGWISRDFASPTSPGRATLSSRAVTLGARVHHLLLGLEPSAFAGVVFARSTLEVPPVAAPGANVETALSTGFAMGLALDVPFGTTFSVGADWRWLQVSGRFERLGGGTLALGGHAVGGVVRLYWP
jgi:hypothetical protein